MRIPMHGSRQAHRNISRVQTSIFGGELTSKQIADATLPTDVWKGGNIRSPFSTELPQLQVSNIHFNTRDKKHVRRRPAYSLSLRTGPSLMSTSNKCSFWYRSVIAPRSSIQRSVFFTLFGLSPGSWMPTWIGNVDRRASSHKPWTNSLSSTDLARATLSCAELAM
jgi:hypothetical protein